MLTMRQVREWQSFCTCGRCWRNTSFSHCCTRRNDTKERSYMHLYLLRFLTNNNPGTFKSGLGGNWISDQIRLLFSQSQPPVPLTPHYLVASKRPVDAGAAAQATMRSFATPPHASFRRLQEERVLTEFKESCVQIWNAAAYGGSNLSANIDTAKNLPGRAFEMPDGWSNVFGIERYRAAEGLFDETAAVTVS